MKKYDVHLDIDAEDDLFEIYRYVALSDSVAQADQLFDHIRRTCYSLRTSPSRGNTPPELESIGVIQFREIRYRHFRVIYSLEGRTVTVHCILDGRRDMQSILQDRLLR